MPARVTESTANNAMENFPRDGSGRIGVDAHTIVVSCLRTSSIESARIDWSRFVEHPSSPVCARSLQSPLFRPHLAQYRASDVYMDPQSAQ